MPKRTVVIFGAIFYIFAPMTFKKYTQQFSYNIQLAYPVILGMLGHTLVGIIDNIMVGKLGATELAAVSLGNSFIFLAMSLGIGFSTAITPLIAEADGTSDLQQSKAAFYNGIFLCTILGVFLFLGIYFIKPLLALMGQPEAVVTLAKPYLDMVAVSLIPLVIFQAYKQFADGKGETKYAMWAVLIANIVNIIVNYFCIYGIWIFPKMGIVGAAVGTLVARFVMLVYMHLALQYRPKFEAYFEHFSWKLIQKQMSLKIIKLGIPSALQMFFEVTLFISAVWLCGIISVESQAANQIAISYASVSFMFAVGLSVTAMIRVGNLKGQNDFENLKTIAQSIFVLTILIEIIFALIFVLFHEKLPTLFLSANALENQASNIEVIAISAKLLLIAALFQMVDGVQVVVLGALRGLQDAKIPMYITFVAYWMVGFPISYYLGLYTELKAQGVWIGLLAGLASAAVLLYIRFIYITKTKTS